MLQGPLPPVRPCVLWDLERSRRPGQLDCTLFGAHPMASRTASIHSNMQGWGRRAGAQKREGQLHLEVLGVQRRRRRAFWNQLVSGKAGPWRTLGSSRV